MGAVVPGCPLHECAAAFAGQIWPEAERALCCGRYETCAGENCYFTLRSLLILCPSYLVFMIANGGLALPGGLFMPSIMVCLVSTGASSVMHLQELSWKMAGSHPCPCAALPSMWPFTSSGCLLVPATPHSALRN